MDNIDMECVKTLRFLAADEVEKAKSGHPGFPLGNAPLIYTLWDRFMKYNPANPQWFNRDRFVLSPGHGSALLYAMLHLAGYGVSLEDLQNFRQWGSITPGHPEVGLTPGVDVSTGPLGHGFAMGVGLALAESMLAAKYNRPGYPLIDHYTFGITSDGDQMEGVTSEAASLAGTLGLGKLIYLYDDNRITIEGDTRGAFRENVGMRFEAYGWQVLRVDNSENIGALAMAIEMAKRDRVRPSLIIVRTRIGYGTVKQDMASCHGEPLGKEVLAEAKARAGWDPEKMFQVPAQVREHFQAKLAGCRQWEEEWNMLFQAYSVKFPDLAMELHNRMTDDFTVDIDKLFQLFDGKEKLATREAGGEVINALAKMLPALYGGSADLGPSNKTVMKQEKYYSAEDPTGRNIHFGIREHAMGCILNGMNLHGGFIPFGSTFAVFADFLRPSIRMAALMKQGSIFVLTHDSIAVGEDGPTHQPIETLMGLRLIPDNCVIRPADAYETAVAWKQACLNRNRPTCLLLSRQGLPVLQAYKDVIRNGAEHGAYVISPAKNAARLIVVASGSEVALALEVQTALWGENIDVAVVSMPSWDIFGSQSDEYKKSVFPAGVRVLSVEAGTTCGWERYADASVGINHFGASAPGGVLMEKFGFNVVNVVAKAKELLQ